MKFFVLLALLPCILSAEVQNAVCVDGTQCPLGKYCCESACCDMSKEMQDKGIVPALPPIAPFNVSLLKAEPKSERMHDFCLGTECAFYCHPGNYGATCCKNPIYACPSKTRCCSNSFSQHPWCCRLSQSCSSMRNMCINSAFATSTANVSMLFAFIIGIASKYFL